MRASPGGILALTSLSLCGISELLEPLNKLGVELTDRCPLRPDRDMLVPFEVSSTARKQRSQQYLWIAGSEEDDPETQMGMQGMREAVRV